MITKLTIQNFRGLKNVTLDRLQRVNLLVGGNDTGKTSVLEAISLLLGDSSVAQNLPVEFRSNPKTKLSVNGNVRDDYENFWLWLYNDRTPDNRIAIQAHSEEGQSIRVVSQTDPTMLVRYLPDGSHAELARFGTAAIAVSTFGFVKGMKVAQLSVHPSDPAEIAEKYNQVALNADGEKRIEEVMRTINPSVRRLRYAKLPGTSAPLVYVDIGLSQAIPAPQMGQAFNRLLHIYTEILSTQANILLVDEIENGIFSENLLPIWTGLLTVCEQENVQTFATTHSLECVHAALAAADQRGQEELVVQRLQVFKNQIEAVALSQETCSYAIANQMEIRR